MNRRYFYLLSFLEGGSVMACELIGAKILAPYFGTSLYVWAAALGLTLGGLMCGYFLGGLLSKRFPDQTRLLFYLLILAGLFTALMPVSSQWIMTYAIHLNLQLGAILSLLIFLAPPLIFMGMISPMVINLLNQKVKDAGNSAGNVYAISTFGGIIMTFLMGFYVIPNFGISYPAIFIGIVLSLLPAISLLRRKEWKTLLIVPFFLFALINTNQRISEAHAPELKYHSEGVMGQIKVIDLPMEISDTAMTGRCLVINNSIQTVQILENPELDFYPYTYYIPKFAEAFPKGGKALILGMGGGTLVRRLSKLGFDLDVVEIDGRLKEVAIAHFGLSANTNIIIDDARHYLRTCGQQYDLIIYDTYISESAPEHMLTIEGLGEARKCLKPEGSLLINFYGYFEGPRGKVVRSVHKTILAAGLSSRLFTTPGDEKDRNIIFIAGKPGHQLDQEMLPEARSTPEAFDPFFLDPAKIDTSEAIILTDERPQQGLYAKASGEWRRRYNQNFTLQFSNYRRY
ncbi:MAG: fused MFS/spermidine synthase [Saprospiraceae bacterium]|nr:fused MFS/spermidine synthase [Saprospiraceae bacterium]